MDHIRSFGRVMDTMVQGSPDIAALIWGGVRLIAEICVRPIRLHDRILQTLENLTKYLPLFEEWRRLFPSESFTELLKSMQATCNVFIGFIVDALSFLRRKPIVNTLRVAFVPGVESTFEEHETKIRHETSHLRLQIDTAGLKANAAHFETIQKLLEAPCRSNKPDSSGPPPSLPFRFLQNCARNNAFFGRSETLSDINTGLEAGLDTTSGRGIASIVIHGLGGLGKTSVAIEYMYRHFEQYKVILWIYADKKDKIDRDFESIAGILGFEIGTKFRTPVDAVIHWINHLGEPWLLVFDNADDISILNNYWPAANHGSLIVTSRNPFPSKSAFAATGLHLHPFSEVDGAEFVLSYLSDLGPLSNDDENAARIISSRFDGLPLGLRQAAFFMRSKRCLPSEFLQLYSRQFEMIERVRVPGHYTKTVADVWEMSIGTLSDDAAALLDMLTLLDPDAIPTELFRQFAHTTNMNNFLQGPMAYFDATECLADQSLIDINVQQQSLRMHRYFQEATFRKLAAAGSRLQTIYSAIVEAVRCALPDDDFLSMQHVDSWEKCRLYSSHADTLYQRSFSGMLTGATNDLLVLLCKIAAYYQETGQYDACQSTIDKAKEVMKKNEQVYPDPDALSRVHYYQGRCCLETNRPAEALESFHSAMALYTSIYPDHPDQNEETYLAILEENLGMSCIANERFEEAETYLKHCIELGQRPEAKVKVVLGDFMQCLGACYLWKGDLLKAEDVLCRAIMLPCGENNENRAGALYSLGNTYFKQKRYSDALRIHREVLELYVTDLGSFHPWVADSYHKVGCILSVDGFEGQDLCQAEYNSPSPPLQNFIVDDNHRALLRRSLHIMRSPGQKGTNRASACSARTAWKLAQVLSITDPGNAEALELLEETTRYMWDVKGRELVGTAEDETLLDGLVLYWTR